MQSADKHIQLFVSTKGPATIKNHSWMDSTVGDDLALVTLSSDHPYFCTDCSYYIGVYSLDAEEEEHPIDVEVAVECPDGVCLSCDTGYDPATNCQDCLPGYFGATCEPCKGCAHGTCDSGKQGSGKCVCEEGWGPEDVCNECKAGFWGLQCEACPSCHGHGQCSDGIDGTGQCVCEGNWDPRVDCEDCIAGFWGAACMGECPRNEEGLICSGHGKCNDKDFGNGRCTCEDGMVGIKCDTKKEEDKCSPPCSELHGACDEEQGVCVCYDGYKGKTCESSQNVMVIIVGVALCVYAYFKAKKCNYPKQDHFSMRQFLYSFKDALWALIMPVIILGGIYAGIFTPTESAAVAVFYGVLVCMVIYREVSGKDLYEILKNTAVSVSNLMILVVTAQLFGYILTYYRIPVYVTNLFMAVASNKYVFLILINLLLIIVGMFMEVGATNLILGPILAPIAASFGIDPVHFGLVFVFLLALGQATPPFGTTMFVACGISKVSMADIAKQLLPFIAVEILCGLLFSFVPVLSTWIPGFLA